MTQLQWVKQQLIDRGEVSRNDAINNRITRLAAIIGQLKKQGWDIETHREKTLFGVGDYIYIKKNRPLNTQEANNYIRSLNVNL